MSAIGWIGGKLKPCLLMLGCVLGAFLMSSCNVLSRILAPEDSLRNRTMETAVLLSPGVALKGRAVTGKPDYFAFKAEAGRTIVFRVQIQDVRDCTAYRVHGPDKEVLYQDDVEKDNEGEPLRLCSSIDRSKPPVKAEGVVFKELKDFGVELRIPARKVGMYFLSIHEKMEVEIERMTSDYRITATIE